jgi:hypothetical protein
MARNYAAANHRIHALYARDHAALGPAGTDQLLAMGRQWRLVPVLETGGAIVFPHASVGDCGHHTAAAIQAVLDSGASRVIVISVLHAWTAEMDDARNRLAAGEDLSGHPLRGIQGPGIPHRDEWRLDHALTTWRFLWEAECDRRGLSVERRPEVVERYPFLGGPDPTTLAGYDELARLAEDAAIVSTADPFHHGIGYGDDPAVARTPAAGGLDLAAASIAEGHLLLQSGAYMEFVRHCVRARNDARDAGPLLHTLRPAASIAVLDIVASDMTELYVAPAPTWVAGALTAWHAA